jgi:hypothetical protein
MEVPTLTFQPRRRLDSPKPLPGGQRKGQFIFPWPILSNKKYLASAYFDG